MILNDRTANQQTSPEDAEYRIGLLDSGVGGLSVLREVHRQLPGISVSYIGDTANVPYGEKPIPVLRELAIRLTTELIQSGVSAVIMASGTSTVAGLEPARQLYPGFPIFGVIEPGAKAALEHTQGPIGVMATTATVRSLAYTHAVHQIDPTREVIEVACPRFVPLVEFGQADSDEAVDACIEYLQHFIHNKVSAIILGCTHFPFMQQSLEKAIKITGNQIDVIFVDPAVDAVKDAAKALGVNNSGLMKGHTDFYCTGNPNLFAENASLLLGSQVKDVTFLDLSAQPVR